MKRYSILAATAVVGVGVAYQGSVNLQAGTPGSPQNGHSNISGTSKAGFFVGNGMFLTNLNAGALNSGIITLTGSSPTYIIRGTNDSGAANATGLIGIANSPTGATYGGWFESKSVSGRALFGYASSLTGATYGTYAQNNSDAGRASFGLATSTTGFTYGGFFSTLSNAGKGVYGQATNANGVTYGVYGKATSPSGFGVYSEGNMSASGTISGNGSGLTAVNADLIDGLNSTAFLQSIPVPLSLLGTSATSIVSAQNNSSANFSSAVLGIGAAGSGITSGVWGQSASTSGRGVTGYASAATGNTFGGVFQSDSSTGRGVFGLSTANVATDTGDGVYGETNSGLGHGVFGLNTRVGSDSFGVFGQSLGSYGSVGQGPLFGVYALGNSGATGVKSFRIDHPSDPENKYLLHYAAESPMPQNFYVGNVLTDSKGYAWVELPDYFDEVNINFKYQLTVISEGDAFVQTMVSKEIRQNRFQVRSSAPNTKVSWRVDADRNDLYVRSKPPKDVVEKEGKDRGTYQHPELYGLGPERGIFYNPAREKVLKPKAR